MPKNYIIHQIPLLYTEMPMTNMTYMFNYGKTTRTGHCVWYIEGPREKILIDAGQTVELTIARGFSGKNLGSLDEGLKKLGLEFADIDTILLTHSDFDHLALAKKFPRARVVIQKAELEFARNCDAYPWFKALRLDIYPQLIEGLKFEVVEGDTRIDDNIELLFSPGHTPGGQSIAVKTAKGTAIVTGWCCVDESFDVPAKYKEKGLPFFVTMLHVNPKQLYESASRVVKQADILIPVHGVKLLSQPTIP